MSKKKEKKTDKEIKELKDAILEKLSSAKTNKIDLVIGTDKLRNLEIR